MEFFLEFLFVLACLGVVGVHREHREVNVDVELQFLANYVVLSKREGHEAVPRNKEVFSLAQVEGLVLFGIIVGNYIQHVVQTCVLIQDKVPLHITLRI